MLEAREVLWVALSLRHFVTSIRAKSNDKKKRRRHEKTFVVFVDAIKVLDVYIV